MYCGNKISAYICINNNEKQHKMKNTKNNLVRLERVIKMTTSIRAKVPSEMNYEELKKYAQYNRIIYNLSSLIK